MTAYATRGDLYAYGLSRGLLANPGRLVAAVYPASNAIELDDHGFELDNELLFRVEDGGTLPAEIAAGTTYYAIPLTDRTFAIAATPGGAAINITTSGDLVVVSASLEPTIDAVLEQYSRLFDSYLPAHAVPLEAPYPTVAVNAVAELAAAKLLAITGQASALIQASAEQTRRELARLAKGVPLRDARATVPANLAFASSPSGARPWSTSDGSIP